MLKKSEPQSLENYLAQIERELRDLPATARADEMREIEAHLRTMVEASGDVADVLAQFGKPRKVGRDLRRAWERKQPEAWWRAVLAPIAGVISFATSVLVYNRTLDYLLDISNGIWTPSLYCYVGLSALVMFFFAGFTAGIVSPRRGVLLTLFYCLYCAYELFISPSGIDEDASVVYILLFIFLVGPIAALAGTYFGARRGRKMSERLESVGKKVLAHIAEGRQLLSRIAGDSKLNVQL